MVGGLGRIVQTGENEKKQLDKCKDLTLSYSELELLFHEYGRIGESIPTWLAEKLGATVYGKCLNDAADKFKEYAGAGPDDLEKLYEEELPKIIDSALDKGENALGQVRYEKLNNARKWLDQLERTAELEFRFEAFHQSPAYTYRPAWRIAVLPPNNSSRKAWYYHPFADTTKSIDEDYDEWGDGPVTEKNCDLKQFSTKFKWDYGDLVIIEIHDTWWVDGKMITWSSGSLSDSLKESGHDLPGLTFMVFWEAHADWKRGIDKKYHYRLELKKEGNGNEMIRPPAFLLEANKRR